MIVVDASAIVDVIAGRPSSRLLQRLGDEPALHAPHLLDVEVWSALRAGVARSSLTDLQADEARTLFHSMTIDRYPHRPLDDHVWRLRHNLSTYDATYVALAAALDAVLVTNDARLAAAPRTGIDIECYSS